MLLLTHNKAIGRVESVVVFLFINVEDWVADAIWILLESEN